MAMTVRLPPELDARLEKIAAARHISKHALLLQAVEHVADAEERVAAATAIAADVRSKYADLLRRLEDA